MIDGWLPSPGTPVTVAQPIEFDSDSDSIVIAVQYPTGAIEVAYDEDGFSLAYASTAGFDGSSIVASGGRFHVVLRRRSGWYLTPQIKIYESTGTAMADELTPIDLDMHEIENLAVFDVQPAALITFADDMSVTTLTRFTQISDGTPVTPTIASNLMTLNMPAGAAKINMLLEGADIGMPQFMHTLRVDSLTHSGADTNAGENISVGICKDTSNFIMALWQRKTGTFGTVSLQVKIGGVQNLRGVVTLGAALVPPFDMGLSCVANSLTWWHRPNGGTWTKLTSFSVIGDFNMKTSSLTGWKPAMRLTASGTDQVAYKVTDFNVGRFGSVSFRDPVVVSNDDGSARLTDNQAYLTATCTDPQGINYCGVFTTDLVERTLTQIGLIMVSRGGAIQPDTAAHLIAYDGGTYRLFLTTWGNFGTGAANIQILYKNETSLNLLSGANVVSGMTQLTLPTVGSGGAYDPYVIKVGSTWYMAHTVGPVTPSTFYPALVSSTDLSTWSTVGTDAASILYEGTRIVFLDGQYWVMAASLADTNVYDLTMSYQGKFRSLAQDTGAPSHPMLVPLGQYVYYLTFDNTQFASVSGNWGHFRGFRARRYGAHL